ncbi:Sacsin [Mytilus edulis]|uniref:Sacsin n=1 Tax=Mytilus edulis TaxID=6550 RepID=A0A8S3T068_MYTED|nr:Sacsin [Mytilus edulis]
MQDSGAHMLPIAATAAMIQDNNGTSIAVPLLDAPYGFCDSSHLFCVLPLPIETPFNVHISGSFAVTQDRTQLSIETSDDKQRFELNWKPSSHERCSCEISIFLLQGLREMNVKPGKIYIYCGRVYKSRVCDKQKVKCLRPVLETIFEWLNNECKTSIDGNERGNEITISTFAKLNMSVDKRHIVESKSKLLQNADDAGATEIHFVTDFNNYSSAKLFDGNFKELQGPSLLVYNNSSFAENDLKCIQLLGIGSKRKDPTSTGKYGVGFNAVYHLTDVPSFITKGEKMDKGNRTLCIFDPLCKYANGANKQKPGSRYYDLDVLKDTVPDVFVPYHEEYLMGDEEKDEESWFVVETIGFNKDVVPDEVHHAYSTGGLGLLPQGGVALLSQTLHKNNSVPFVSYLLPIITGLPMHVNGHFALNHESRRNLWEDNKESLERVKHIISVEPSPRRHSESELVKRCLDIFADVLPTLKLAQHKNENDSIAHVLSKWYLLPIRRGQQYELERIGRSKYVIYRESFTVDKPMHDALQRIEMPELDTRAFKVAKGLVVSCDNSLDVFECLVHNLRSHQKAISEDDCSAILEYLNDNLETFELEYPINEILEKLRSIPVFITVDGYNTNVGNYYTKVLVLPTNIPFVGLEEWANSSGIVLLKKITRITHLHIKLKFVACNTCELYSKYIIPNFQNMPQLAHLEHLEYIRDNILLKGIDGEF